MTAMAFDPMLIAPMLFGDTAATHTYVQDSSALAEPGEQLSWWQLMVRHVPFTGQHPDCLKKVEDDPEMFSVVQGTPKQLARLLTRWQEGISNIR